MKKDKNIQTKEDNKEINSINEKIDNLSIQLQHIKPLIEKLNITNPINKEFEEMKEEKNEKRFKI